jgi:hypothetical protein
LSSEITFSTREDGAGMFNVVRKTTPAIRLTNKKIMNKRAIFDIIPKRIARLIAEKTADLYLLLSVQKGEVVPVVILYYKL